MLKRVLPGLILAIAALGYAVLACVTVRGFDADVVALCLLVVVAVGCARWLPSVALGALWFLLLFHLAGGLPFILPELGVLYVGFACAAWGSRGTLGASLLSIPLAAGLIAKLLLDLVNTRPWLVDEFLSDWGLRDAAESARSSPWGPGLVVGVTGLLLLTVPWLLGLAVRLARRSEDSRRSAVLAEGARAQAQVERQAAETARDAADEVARLQEGQAQLARDVHDVVGHSLTVILAQAEAAQFQQEPDALHRTLSTIVDTARASLTDIRNVLHATGSQPIIPAEEDLHTLLQGVRASGREVTLVDVGAARPLPPDRAPVAHRVLQEMLTNAVRHGAPGGAIQIERHWAGELRLEVTNAVSGTPPDAIAGSDETQPLILGPDGYSPAREPAGHGVSGMRRRLEAVGGRLDCRQRFDPATYTATAWLPLSGRHEVTR